MPIFYPDLKRRMRSYCLVFLISLTSVAVDLVLESGDERIPATRLQNGVGSAQSVTTPLLNGTSSWRIQANSGSSFGLIDLRTLSGGNQDFSDRGTLSYWVNIPSGNTYAGQTFAVKLYFGTGNAGTQNQWVQNPRVHLESLAFDTWTEIIVPLREEFWVHDEGTTGAFDLSDVNRIGFILLRHGQGTTTVYLDDAVLKTEGITVTSDPSVVLADSGPINFNTTVIDGGVPVNEGQIDFEVITEAVSGGGNFSGSQSTSQSITAGSASASYTPGNQPALVEVSIQHASNASFPDVTFFVHQEILDDFEHGINFNGGFTESFGTDLLQPPIAESGGISIFEDDQIIEDDKSVLRLRSNTQFNSGSPIIGAGKTFTMPFDLSNTSFNTLSYRVRSASDNPDPLDPSKSFKAFIQLVFKNGSFWEQIEQVEVTTSYQEVKTLLTDTAGFKLGEGSPMGAFDPANISGIRYFLSRGNNTDGGEHAVYFDDVRFQFFAVEEVAAFEIIIADDKSASVNQEPFINATFPVLVIPKNGVGACVDIPEPGIPISLSTDIGTLTMWNEGTSATELTLVVDCLENDSPEPFYISIAGVATDSEFAIMAEFDNNGTLVQGTTTSMLRDGTSLKGELEFLENSQDDSTDGLANEGMVASFPNSGSAFTFSNALAVIAFTHKGSVVDAEPLDIIPDPECLVSYDDSMCSNPFLSRAHAVLSAFEKGQIPITGQNSDTRTSPTENNGGFFDVYSVDGSPPKDKDENPIVTVTTGNNAWLMMAINYYTLFSGDTQFEIMAKELAGFLAGRQIDEGGLYTRDTDPLTFVAEHQGQAYSAFRYYAGMPWLTSDVIDSPDNPNTWLERADDVEDFMISKLFIPSEQRFRVATGGPPFVSPPTPEPNPATDAQTSPFFALQLSETDYSPALDFIFDLTSGLIREEEEFQERPITGAKFKKDGTHVWVEGSAQLALALKLLTILGTADQDDRDRFNLIATNLQKVQNANGGYPTFLGTEIDHDESPPLEVGNDAPESAVSSWRYFAEADPPVNPYVLIPTLVVTQSDLLASSKKSGTIEIIARTGFGNNPVIDQDASFTIISDCPGGDLIPPISGKTDGNGAFKVDYQIGSSPCVSVIETNVTSDFEFPSKKIYILQDFIEDFNHGLSAGGALLGFGKNEMILLEDGQGNGINPNPTSTIDSALRLSTSANGFGPGEDQSGDFVGISKTFSSSQNAETDTNRDSNSVDFSGNFNSISYFVKNTSTVNEEIQVAVFIEVVIGDGGDISPNDSSDNFTGSTWSQTIPKRLSEIVPDTGNNDFEQVVVALKGSTTGAENGFLRTVAPSNPDDHSDLASLTNNITKVNVVMTANGDQGVARSVLIDDISLLNVMNLAVFQEKVFVPSAQRFPNSTVKVTASVTGADDVGVQGCGINFIVIPDPEGTLSDFTKETDESGKVAFEYTISDHSEIVEIQVEKRE